MNTTDRLLQKIESLQFSADTQKFRKGMFRTERFHCCLPYWREEDNIFYPASIAFVLLQLQNKFTPAQADAVNRVVNGIRANYPYYSGLQLEYTYNFYCIRPDRHFPNGTILSRIKHFRLPEDADDTSLVSLTLENMPAETVHTLHQKFAQHANLSRKQIQDIDPRYASLPFYTTWLDSGKMPMDLDICVICNMLSFVFKHELELNAQDKASLEVLRRAIESNDIVNNSFYISGSYARPSILLYHLARLCTFMENPTEHIDTEKLVQLIRAQWDKSSGFMDRLLLSIALMKLGQPSEPLLWNMDDPHLKNEFKTFAFFIAPMGTGTHSAFLNWLKSKRIVHILYRNEAFYYTLLLEHALLSNTE
ncbi:MAG: hypothetical protein WC760_11555 [Bacteroidia bacterium]